MRQLHRSLRLIPLLLAGAALAACDQRTPDLPTGARAAVGEAGVAPLIAAGPEAIPGQYVVVMKPGAGTAAAVAREVVSAHGGKLRHTYSATLNGFAANLSPAAVDALRRNPQVEYVAEDAMAYPDTSQAGATWGLDRIDQRGLPLNTTYNYTHNGAGVRVYVVDTGIRTTHAQFGGRASVGTDLVGDGQNGQDCNGHGTHVAGTIAGTTYGVAKGAQVISVRVFGCTGGAEWSRIIAAVDWVTANAVKPAVVNMSLGGSYYAAMNTAVTNSVASGLTYALAAGNSTIDACGYSPASTPTAITVGSTSSNDVRSYFSNFGTCVDLFAPGSDITSAWWTSDTAINTISGTSMASPHAAGVAALYLQTNPTATPATVATALVSTTTAGRLTDLGTGSPNKMLFSGLTVETPAAVIGLNPGALTFTFVRTVGGAAAEPGAETQTARQAFAASGEGEPRAEPAGAAAGDEATATSLVLSSRVILSNTGTTALNWTAASNRPWLTADPTEGALNAPHSTVLNATVNAAGLAPGTHTGAVAVTGPEASSPGSLGVTVNVTDALALLIGTPRTGLAGASGSQTYYAVQVPVGATTLTIGTTGGSGDADLYVRYGNVPTLGEFDCRPYIGGNVETCHATNPLPGTYYVMLRGFGSYTGLTLSAGTGGPPAAPRTVAARPLTPTSIQVTWADSSVNETGFVVSSRTLSATGVWSSWANVVTTAPNATSFTHTGRVAGTRYQYRVRACNAAGCSAYAIGTAVTIPTAAPAPPFNLIATPTSGTSALVSWTDGSTDESGFTLSRALRNADGTWGAYATVRSPAADVTSYANTGLVAGSQYRYQLRACNTAGCSAWVTSNIVTMPTLPAAPTAISGAQIAAGSIRVQWTDGSTNETSFPLERAVVSSSGSVGAFGLVATVAPNQVQFTNNGLAAGTYRYRIRACNAAGCSPWATTGNVVIVPVPAAPMPLTASPLSATSIRLTWTDGPVETSYQVYRTLRNVDGTWPSYASLATLPANSALHDDTGLLSGRQYRYQLRACNVSGCSAWATSAVTTTP
jgi:subtilisin family serine protease